MTGEMGDKVDFEAEGLLDGLEGKQRESRLKLLTDLHERGAGLEELRRAVTDGQLALVAVDLVLSGDGKRLTASEVAERAGHRGGVPRTAVAGAGDGARRRRRGGLLRARRRGGEAARDDPRRRHSRRGHPRDRRACSG